MEGGVGWQGDPHLINSTWETEIQSQTTIKKITYSFGTLWADTKVRGGRRFSYVARKDCGIFDRHGSFTMSPTSFLGGYVNRELQQTSTASYPKYCLGPLRDGKPWSTEGMNQAEIKETCAEIISYDRGHLVPANHLDHDKLQIKESNYMINIVPRES